MLLWLPAHRDQQANKVNQVLLAGDCFGSGTGNPGHDAKKAGIEACSAPPRSRSWSVRQFGMDGQSLAETMQVISGDHLERQNAKL